MLVKLWYPIARMHKKSPQNQLQQIDDFFPSNYHFTSLPLNEDRKSIGSPVLKW